MDKDSLLTLVNTHLPVAGLPAGIPSLLRHGPDCLECRDLSAILQGVRDAPVTATTIRNIYQDMYCLSAQGWAWFLPHYLLHCLENESPYTRIETEFLLYKLAPDAQFQEDTRLHLGLLNPAQIDTLLQFLIWMRDHPHWSAYCPDTIETALRFLESLK